MCVCVCVCCFGVAACGQRVVWWNGWCTDAESLRLQSDCGFQALQAESAAVPTLAHHRLVSGYTPWGGVSCVSLIPTPQSGLHNSLSLVLGTPTCLPVHVCMQGMLGADEHVKCLLEH